MGSLILIDTFEKTIDGKHFLVAVVYSKKAKSIHKIYKAFGDDLSSYLNDRYMTDISSVIVPKLKSDGTAGLDIDIDI